MNRNPDSWIMRVISWKLYLCFLAAAALADHVSSRVTGQKRHFVKYPRQTHKANTQTVSLRIRVLENSFVWNTSQLCFKEFCELTLKFSLVFAQSHSESKTSDGN